LYRILRGGPGTVWEGEEGKTSTNVFGKIGEEDEKKRNKGGPVRWKTDTEGKRTRKKMVGKNTAGSGYDAVGEERIKREKIPEGANAGGKEGRKKGGWREEGEEKREKRGLLAALKKKKEGTTG